MTNEERDLIARFLARVGGAASPGAFGGPAQAPASLPPIDPEADRFIAENFQKFPEARYRVTQMAVVQEVALAEAQNRIRQLQFELQQTQAQLAQTQQQRPASGGIFGGLFGGGAPRQQAALPPGWGQQPGYAAGPPPAYAPGVNPGMFQRGGTGFLGSALTTATGVAGGMLAANALESLFSGGHGQNAAGGFGGGETIVNNNYGDAAGSDPFAGDGTDAGSSFDAGSFGDDGGGGWDDNSF
ncbi:DUF2076 domain-containing protein [Brytella acorum]|uniref:DUF2076 domain-containing protein n=1 Tax=Brytella acorum TaxID=2959299 RepID=A0AA35Y2Y9_9PROT|nr:DUF2076 domain-containing protein [Brytella acorum]MDF3625457.1 DUF2076 domain-containing protein [Brytella acorum]CAI9120308.1 DUF2076 domain-containing protein [Brytella acorum]